jgi:VanZ family protein
MLKPRNPIKPTFPYFIPAIVWFLLVLYLLTMPATNIPQLDDWFSKYKLDKLAHTFLFAILTIAFIWPVGWSYFSNSRKYHIFVKIGIATSIWGLATEFIQKYLVIGRSFEMADWAFDTTGVILAVVFSKYFFLKDIFNK